MPIRRSILKAATAVLSAPLLAGCAAGATTSTRLATDPPNPRIATSQSPRISPANVAGSFSIIDTAGPPPVVLGDTSPSHLDLSLYLSVGGYDSSTRNMTEMAISFSSRGRRVQFVADERVTCNGVALQRGGGTFDVKVSSDAFASKLVTCTYTSGRSAATVAFTMPVAPTIVSPQDNVELARSTKTAVTFRIGGHSTMFYVIALGPSSKAWSYPVGTRPTQALLDTSAFSPGPGFVALSQSFDLPDLHGSGFQSVDAQGSATQQNRVTWVQPS